MHSTETKPWNDLMIEQNANVNVCDTLKRIPLHIAASEGQVCRFYCFLRSQLSFWHFVNYFCSLSLEVVEYLISCKADLNAEDQFKNTCLNDAVRHGWEICIVLHTTFANWSTQLLIYISRKAGTVLEVVHWLGTADSLPPSLKCYERTTLCLEAQFSMKYSISFLCAVFLKAKYYQFCYLLVDLAEFVQQYRLWSFMDKLI